MVYRISNGADLQYIFKKYNKDDDYSLDGYNFIVDCLDYHYTDFEINYEVDIDNICDKFIEYNELDDALNDWVDNNTKREIVDKVIEASDYNPDYDPLDSWFDKIEYIEMNDDLTSEVIELVEQDNPNIELHQLNYLGHIMVVQV